jgi:hypothetical protein
MTTEIAGPYKYNPLPHGEYIRLLQLLPSTGGFEDTTDIDVGGHTVYVRVFKDPVHIRLLTVPIDEAPPYQAISYAWGDLEQQAQVYCDSHSITVARSLVTALQYFRSRYETTVLWADGVCINQFDELEKGHQVDLMGCLFSKATQVLVWLGEDLYLDAAIAREYIQSVNSHARKECQRWIEQPLMRAARPNISAIALSHPFITDHYARRSVERLLSNPFFSRLWVQQEIGLAVECLAHCGYVTMNLSDIVVFSMVKDELALRFHTKSANRVRKAYAVIWSTFNDTNGIPLWASRDQLLEAWGPGPSDFLSTVMMGTYYKTTDPRDHLYALLGHPMAKSETGELICTADYGLSMDQLNVQFVKACIQTFKSLNLLMYIKHKSFSEMLAAPSWIPDLAKTLGTRLNGNGYQADASHRVIVDCTVQDTMLVTQAIIFDSVNDCTPITYNFEKEHAEGMATAYNLFSQAHMDKTSVIQSFTAALFERPYPAKLKHCEAFLTYMSERNEETMTDQPMPNLNETQKNKARSHFHKMMRKISVRQSFTTVDNKHGMGPALAQKGDLCCIVFGCDVPLILRPASTEGHYYLVGPCWILNVMYGELTESWLDGELPNVKEQKIVLI